MRDSVPKAQRELPKWLLKPVSRRALAVGSGIWIAVLLTPLILLCFYARPVYDDFTHTLTTAEAWAQTGSLWAAVKAAWQHMLLMYQNWQGTWVAMFLSAFAPMAFSSRLHFLSPLITLCLLTASSAYFTTTVGRKMLHLQPTATLPLLALFLTLWLGYLPGADEAVYWLSGMPYALSAILFVFILALLLNQHFSTPRLWRILALVCTGLLLGGCTYPLALGGCVALLLITLWAFFRRSSARYGALFTLIATAVSLFIVVLAPGNAVRQARSGAAMMPLAAIVHSLAEGLQTIGSWFSPQLIACGILLTALLWKPLRESRLSFQYPLLFTLFSFGALAAAFVPAIYATGVEGAQVDRIQAVLYLFFIPLSLGNIVYWLGWLSQRSFQFQPSLTRWKLWLCMALAVWGLFTSAIMTTPFVASAVTLATGDASKYSTEMDARANAIASAATLEEAIASVDALSVAPVLFPNDGMTLYKEAVVPKMHRYYAIQALLAQYPAGEIPKTEWNQLDTWE